MHPGQRIGKYVLGEKIAVGGMAEVWAARAEGPEGFVKPVALKFILESFSGDPELEKLFVKEARIAAQLQHANLVSVFDFDKVVVDPERSPSGRYYIAMEHVEGYDARRVAEAAKHAGYVFPLPLALYLGGEVMKGLRYVHERRANRRLLGLVHRDVSPHNVLVGFSGEVKLSDFGIAKSLAHSSRTKTGTIRGKLSYASPEQLNGEPVDHRADQFAMGITLWEIIAGRPLFDGNDEIEIVGKVMRCDVPSLGLVCRERKIPPTVEAFVRKMLSARRDERFSTTADALSALLGLPGYSGDGVGLGELVRTLFHRASVGPASTMNLPVPAAAPAPPAGKGGARRAPAAQRAAGARAAPGDASDDHDREPPPSEIETRTMARAPAPGRRSPSGGRNVTTLQVRDGRDRRWAVIASIAAIAVVAVAVGAAVVASGSRAAPSAQESPATGPGAPLPAGAGSVEPAEQMASPPPTTASRKPTPMESARAPAPSTSLPATGSPEGLPERMATASPPPPTTPPPPPTWTGSPKPVGSPTISTEPSWPTMAVTAPGVPGPAAATSAPPAAPPAAPPETPAPAKPAPKPGSNPQSGAPANGAPIVE